MVMVVVVGGVGVVIKEDGVLVGAQAAVGVVVGASGAEAVEIFRASWYMDLSPFVRLPEHRYILLFFILSLSLLLPLQQQ